jgi:hypothetical protein
MQTKTNQESQLALNQSNTKESGYASLYKHTQTQRKNSSTAIATTQIDEIKVQS